MTLWKQHGQAGEVSGSCPFELRRGPTHPCTSTMRSIPPVPLSFFSVFIYFGGERERERERAGEGQGQRERGKPRQALRTSTEPDGGFKLTNREIVT